MEIKNGFYYLTEEEHAASGLAENPISCETLSHILYGSILVANERIKLLQTTELYPDEAEQQRAIQRSVRQLEILEDLQSLT